MKVTIITPTFNRAHLLPDTIESVLAQTYKDFEYIILDDGSRDNTKDVVQPYLADSRLRYVYHDNMGEAETVNQGWQLARGEYFTQVNSDDPVYPNFLEEMVRHLDACPDKILAYPDFDFIDEDGNVLQTTRGRAWDFLRNLSQYSCEAACPGTVIRRSALQAMDKIKRRGYLHINDIEMYWKIALFGDFLHVPHVLATWRAHSGQISVDRYKSIPECEEWFAQYFSQENLPEAVKAIKPQTRKSLCRYFVSLIEQANLINSEKRKLMKPYLEELEQSAHEFSCIHIGDIDTVGEKFNGHNLHLLLQEKNIDASHFVCSKRSQDCKTFLIDNDNGRKFFESITRNKCFSDADLLHLHLVHNTNFDILHLPILSKLKPIVWTLHDPWAFGGHCIYHIDCDMWKTHCFNCKNIDKPFIRDIDTTALEYEEKKFAIQNSNVHAIVASEWMKNNVAQSPIWVDKPVHLVPFGIDQKIFCPPKNLDDAKQALGIPPTTLVLFARTQRHYKGLEILRIALEQLATHHNFVLLTVGKNGLLPQLPKSILHKEYGWLTDDLDLVKLYQACDLFLMPSEHEAFGMMAIEAMSCGRMVLALDVPSSALPGVINSPHVGIAATQATYADELCRLASAPDEMRHRGKLSLAYARERHGLETYVQKIMSVYKEAMADFVLTDGAKMILLQLQKNTPSVPGGGSPRLPRYMRLKRYYEQYGAIKTSTKILEKIRKKIIQF